jgi:hypothetical protein
MNGGTTNQLVPADRPGQLYIRMQAAISACYSVDDCENIAEQANAIAVYYQQIKDAPPPRPAMTGA